MKKLINHLFLFILSLNSAFVFAGDIVLKSFSDKEKFSKNGKSIPIDKKNQLKGDKNESLHRDSLFKNNKTIPDELSVNVEASLSLNKNSLLKSPYNWSVGIPYSELDLSYKFSEDSSFKMELDFAYLDKQWIYSVDDFSVHYNFLFYIPITFKVGYFSYPVSYTNDNIKTFSKKTLMQKSLFPSGRRDVGALVKWNLWNSFYLKMGIQADIKKRETDALQRLGHHPVLTSRLVYESAEQKAFLAYFQKNFFLEGRMQSFGCGADLSYKIRSWTFKLRGEFWNIRKNTPDQTLLTYYVFPYLRWERISFGSLFGGAHHYLQKDKSHILEYILKADFYLTDNVFFTIEQLKEQDSIIKKKAWSFSLRTHFEI